ncbi:unnamed protein product [Diatraea saccharalis]|uniref:Uncharacterized protein n=1 Tax=Diatraea saccharalis TaxID=40085 RepID=A0A9N9QXP7_9NEOP|nr:unnamed protein product [Diatraea saccharalis]
MSRQNEKVCRICRDVNLTNGISFDTESDLLRLYEFCFLITITSDDSPRYMCIGCTRKLKEFSEFKNQALLSDKLWKSNNITASNNEIKHETFIEEINFSHLSNFSNSDDVGKEKHSSHIKGISEIYDCNMSNDLEYQKEDVDYFDDQTSLINMKVKEELNVEVSMRASKKHCQNRKKKKSDEGKPLPEAPNLICGLCDVDSIDSIEMKQHLVDHNTNDSLNCKLCEFVGRDFADMVTHRYDHHPKEYRINLSCHICNKKYLAKLALQFHYRAVHLKKKGGICTQCGKQFSTYVRWRDHEKLHRTENYKCELCDRKFLFRHALKTHMINHSEVKGYVCDICGKGFKRNSNLKLHLQTAHDSNKVICNHCDGTFKNQKSLKAHLQRVTKDKSFQCNVCSKYFDTPNMLKRHMVWHGDERPYICSVCGLSYKSTSQLNLHMRKHTGILPFKCNQCTKCYPTSNQLREHMSNHSGERRYKCPFCSKSFHHKKLMVKHCSKSHDDKAMETQKQESIGGRDVL